MNKNRNRNTRIIAIIALTIAVFGYSIGFSAYSTTLKMQNIQAIVKGDSSKFKVTLSTASNSTNLEGSRINKSYSYGGSHSNTQVNSANSVTMTATTINNIGGTFGYKGGISYIFYVRNIGDIDAYLTSVVYSNNNRDPSCNAASHVLTVCEDVTLSVTIRDNKRGDLYTSKTTTNASIKSAKLTAGESHEVIINITYTGVNTVISDFSIDYGSITLNYSSQDNK